MLPNLIIIGGMKCGTTSLHYYLSLHPEIFMSKQKELDFFVSEKNWYKGIDWYKTQFAEADKFPVAGESSPNYTSFPQFPNVPQRMHSCLPEAKLIYLVRDPIERMLAQYVHQYSDGTENRDLEEALLNPEKKSYLDRSLYYTQLSHYLEYYKPEQILVFPSSVLRSDTGKALWQIFEFLCVDDRYQSWQTVIQRHKTGRKRRKTFLGNKVSKSFVGRTLEQIPSRLRWPIEELLYFPFSKPIERPKLTNLVRSELKLRLKPDIDQLRHHTGMNFDEWDV